CCTPTSRLSFSGGLSNPRIHRVLLVKAWDYELWRTTDKVGRFLPPKTRSSEPRADLSESAQVLANAVSTESVQSQDLMTADIYLAAVEASALARVHRSGAPSPGCSSRQLASSMGMEPSSTSRAPTSGMWKTAKSRCSTAMSVSASCLHK